MGCASSSPLINGGGPGGIVETAKETASKTATEVLHAGETAIHDVGEHVKDAVQNVTGEIEGLLGGKKVKEETDIADHINENDLPHMNGHDDKEESGYQIIPLKDIKQASVDENLENIKNNILKKAQSFSDDTDQMADDIIKETEDLIRDAETGIADCGSEMTTRITSLEDGTIEILNLEEPEIERIMDNEPHCPPTPEATMNSLMSSDGAATESEAVDSAATVIQKQLSQDKHPDSSHDGSKREARRSNNTSSSRSNSSEIVDGDDNDALDDDASLRLRQPEVTLEAPILDDTVSPEGDGQDTQTAESHYETASVETNDLKKNFSERDERRRNRIHHFSFKLNSVELSIIEEKTDEDSGSVNHHSPEINNVGADGALSGKSTDVSMLSLDDDDGEKAVDSEGNEEVVKLADDEVEELEPELPDNEEDSSELSLKGFEDVEKLLEKMPAVTKLRTLTRFRSFEYPRQVEDDSDEDGELSPKKFNFKEFRAKMQSEDGMNVAVREQSGEQASDDETIVPDEDEDEFDVDAAIEDVLSETMPDDAKEEWGKLQDTPRNVPRGTNSFDLFHDSDDGTLKNLFKKKKNKLLCHSSASSGNSTDTL